MYDRRTMSPSTSAAAAAANAMGNNNNNATATWKEWFCTCACCRKCWSVIWRYCCCCLDSGNDHRKHSIRKEDITYILQHAEGESGTSDTFSEVGGASGNGDGERHGSFTSGSLSVGSSTYSGGGGVGSGGASGPGTSSGGGPFGGSCSPNSKDLKDLVYEKIEARRASNQSQTASSTNTFTASAFGRKESTLSTAPLLDFRSIDFWSAFSLTGSRASTSEPQPVQPQLLLSPGRRDTISSQGSADQIRPDLYESVGAAGNGSSCGEEDGDPPSCTGALGALHFFLSYDVHSRILTVRLIEAKDLPKPITRDSSKTDQAHSNPYVKICLLPNQKESRQTALRKKTQNPHFDENVSFEIPFRELQRRTLQMVVKDFDKYSRHRVIGQVLLPLADINVLKGVYFWKPLEAVQALSQEDLGELLFSLCYLPAAGRLNVDILRAKQLTPTDLVGGAAPYVKVTLVINERHIKTKKTSYKKYTLDPVFNESLSFDVNSVQLPDCAIIITVLDFNGGVIKDHFIGRLVLGKEASGPHEVNHWKNMLQSQRTAIAQWHSLKSRSHCDEHCSVTKLVNY